MIAGYLQNTLVAQANIQNVANEMLATMDRRASKVLTGPAQNSVDPLSLVRITSKLPQFSLEQNNDQLIRQVQNFNYTQQIQQLASPPNIDIINQIREQAKIVRLHYQA